MSRKRKGKKKRTTNAPAKGEAAPAITSPQPEASAAEPPVTSPGAAAKALAANVATSNELASADTPTGRTGSLHGRVACRLLIVTVGHIGFLSLLLSVAAFASPKAQLAGFDLAALPAEPVKLRAKFEIIGPGLFKPVTEDVSLDFFEIGARDALPGPEEGTLIDSALTDDNGSATLAITTPELPGNYFYRVTATDPTQVPLVSPNVFVLVSVAPAEQPIIISAVDETLCEHPLTETVLAHPEEAAPLKGAPEVLSEQAKGHLIVYLSARPARLVAGVRGWLATHGFPIGPLFFRDTDAPLVQRESDYKATIIRSAIKSRWENVPWGIGAFATDAQAFRTNTIRPILVDPQLDSTESAAGTNLRVASWDELRELLDKEAQ